MTAENITTEAESVKPESGVSLPQAVEISRDPQAWNPYYLAYCKAHGAATPEEMLARDSEEYPGGKMAGFMAWTSQQWGAWCKANGAHPDAPRTEADHESFSRFLETA